MHEIFGDNFPKVSSIKMITLSVMIIVKPRNLPQQAVEILFFHAFKFHVFPLIYQLTYHSLPGWKY